MTLRPGLGITLALTCALTFFGPLPARADFAIRGFVIGNGATPASGLTGSGRRLLGTAGQPAVGVSDGTNFKLCHGFWCFGGSRVVSVDEPPPIASELPTRLALGSAWPNPARAAVRFAVELPRAARVDLRIVDLQGRVVREVEDGTLEAGFRTLVWDGRDAGGRRAGAGIYFARLVVEGVPIGTRRVVLRD